ncbi:MAG: Coenzyme F420 hydrogenase/dehydrogenase, beta subunit C-terminal domain [Deltaproteobacteria bacterium]|nr:MAG: Coenzyme F420 hydrogenase/dehydrogenase, beta subunit C-terminal domain [Deltaproteobacteria bacterium]
MSEQIKGPLDLEREVLKRQLCTSCGACVGICPYIKVIKDRVVIIEPCGITEGKCYDICPRTGTNLGALEQMVFGKPVEELALGSLISIEMAQAKDGKVRSAGQYGGLVSALSMYATKTGDVDSFLLTKPFGKDFMPGSVLVNSAPEVLNCARSNYIASPTLAGMNQALKKGKDRLGVVGTPCQVLALRKMQASRFDGIAEKVGLTIGLFCTWALSYRELFQYLKGKLDPALITRLDIPPPPANTLTITTETTEIEIPLDDIREFIKPTCRVCYDMTAELADISVGMVEGIEDWNTLIVRTERGKKFVQKAKKAGVIGTEPLEKARLDHLRDASLQKKKRAVAEITGRTKDVKDLLYLRLRDEVLKELLPKA